MGPMSIPLSEQIHIPHQCSSFSFSIFCDVSWSNVQP
jgi:hypothetical protein